MQSFYPSRPLKQMNNIILLEMRKLSSSQEYIVKGESSRDSNLARLTPNSNFSFTLYCSFVKVQNGLSAIFFSFVITFKKVSSDIWFTFPASYIFFLLLPLSLPSFFSCIYNATDDSISRCPVDGMFYWKCQTKKLKVVTGGILHWKYDFGDRSVVLKMLFLLVPTRNHRNRWPHLLDLLLVSFPFSHTVTKFTFENIC